MSSNSSGKVMQSSECLVLACTIHEARRRYPKLDSMIADYAREAMIPELTPYDPQWELYAALEQSGILQAYVVESPAEELIGFMVLITNKVPHYAKSVVSIESLYGVGPAGAALRRVAEESARKSGAAGLFVSAPTGGRLARLMDRLPQYRETNRVFFKPL